jgi:hypothetical protein
MGDRRDQSRISGERVFLPRPDLPPVVGGLLSLADGVGRIVVLSPV